MLLNQAQEGFEDEAEDDRGGGGWKMGRLTTESLEIRQQGGAATGGSKKHLTNSKSTGTLGWSRLLLVQNSVANGQESGRGHLIGAREAQLHMSSSSCSVASKSLRVATKKALRRIGFCMSLNFQLLMSPS